LDRPGRRRRCAIKRPAESDDMAAQPDPVVFLGLRTRRTVARRHARDALHSSRELENVLRLVEEKRR
jgi:hypothetical protein